MGQKIEELRDFGEDLKAKADAARRMLGPDRMRAITERFNGQAESWLTDAFSKEARDGVGCDTFNWKNLR